MQAAGFVLVGGLSTRMGQDKALLPAASEPLVTTIARQVLEAAGSVALVGRPERYNHLPLDHLEDLRADMGPLAGLEAALASGRGDLNLIVACDMPGLSSQAMRRLLEQARLNGALCTVAVDQAGRTHPLCAVYRTGCLPVIKQALGQKRLRVTDLIEQLGGARIAIESALPNVNTPEEWEAWQRGELQGEVAAR